MKILVDNIKCQCIISGMDSKHVDVYKELREYLRVRPANYAQMLFQMRKHGNNGWDGYTYFMNAKCCFPTGFLSMVINLLKDLNITIALEDRRHNVPKFKSKPWNLFTPEFELAPHQVQLIAKTDNYIGGTDNCIYFPRGIWKAATNAGKTAAAGNLILNIESSRAIMLVDNQDLLKQHYEYYKTVFNKVGELGYITSTKSNPGTILTLAMVRTVYNRLKSSMTVQRDLHDKFNMLLVDEVHGYCSKEAVFVINHINAGLRVGMSGTPIGQSDKIAKFRLIGMFGDMLHTVSNRELMDTGFSMTPIVEIYLNPTIGRAINYDREFAQVITESEDRAELIADIVCKYRNRKVMVTFFDIKHGMLMYDTFCLRYPSLADKATLVHGTSNDRTDIIQDFKDNKIRYLFASTIMQQGFNIADIEVIIYGIGEMAAIPQFQFMGRGMRLDGINNTFVFADIFDRGKYCGKHSRKRILQYKKEDLPIPIDFKYNAGKRGDPK